VTRARSQGGPAGDRRRGDDGGGRALPIAPLVAIAGLLVVAGVTFSLSAGRLPFSSGGTTQGGGGTVAKTATPSGIVVVPDDPRAKVPGTIVYAKDGNLWLQSGSTATQLTTAGKDSMPTFSADGRTVYFIRTRPATGLWPVDGTTKQFAMDVPSVMSIPVAGGTATTLLDGLVDPTGKNVWMAWIRQPAPSPDGKTIALLTDLPSPGSDDVVLQLLDVATGKLTNPKLAETQPLGHQDPAWSPDGTRLLFVRNDRDGTKGTPRIWVYTLATKKSAALTGPGYIHPAWSPDGRWIAATRTDAFGTDVVILNATTGAEILKLTSDGKAWGPMWSPAGDALVFLHVNGQVVDLRMVTLTGSGPGWTIGDSLDLTSGAGLDSVSRPDWFIPADQLPVPTPAPSPSSSGSPPASSGSPASSASPKASVH
jgi:Tol biopolymer transport system component